MPYLEILCAALKKIAVGALKSISYEIIYELARTTWLPVTTLAQLSAIDGMLLISAINTVSYLAI